MHATAMLGAALSLAALPALAQTVALDIAQVNGARINCLFSKQCALQDENHRADQSSAIPIPISGIQRKAILTSRTFVGGNGSPAAGLHAYQYRVEMKDAVASGDPICITDISVDFGQVTKLNYDRDVTREDVYVISRDEPANFIGLTSAQQNGEVITFTFAQPVCSGTGNQDGGVSAFFGLASRNIPRKTNVQVSVGGLENVVAEAITPRHR